MAATVDIVIPVFNAEQTLDAALASIACQEFVDFRVIAIDDGSTDRSGKILRRWRLADDRFAVVQQKNLGIVSALNRGIDLVTAPLIARMDADDICFPQRLRRQVEYLSNAAECVAVGCQVEHIDSAGRRLNGYPQPGDPRFADPWWIPAREPYLIHPFLMARTAAVRRVGGYRPLPHSEDTDLYWRLSEHGRLHNLRDVLGQYRMHAASISSTSIIGGRIMAVGSRLSALSAQRRRSGMPDIEIPNGLISQLTEAETLEQMCQLQRGLMSVPEWGLFKLGSGIKLLELAMYRPYEIEVDDCRFIRGSLPYRRGRPPSNNREIDWYIAQTAARLARSWKLHEVAALTNIRVAPRVALYIFRGAPTPHWSQKASGMGEHRR